MNWDAVGAIAEMLGAIAVVASLAYVGLQVRQNTHAVRAASMDSGLQKGLDFRYQIIDNADVAHIYYEGSRDIDALGEEERMRYRILMHAAMHALWNMYSQYNYGGLPVDIWDAQKPTMVRVLSCSGGQWFWKEFKHEFPPEFRAEVNRVLGQ